MEQIKERWEGIFNFESGRVFEVNFIQSPCQDGAVNQDRLIQEMLNCGEENEASSDLVEIKFSSVEFFATEESIDELNFSISAFHTDSLNDGRRFKYVYGRWFDSGICE